MIRMEGLQVGQGTFKLSGVNLTVPERGYGVLMGASGSGKTTILEAVCGLRPIQAGRITLEAGTVAEVSEKSANIWPPANRAIGYVPQDGALFPTMTVAENIAFGLKVRRVEAEVIDERVGELAGWLGVSRLLARTPHELSGGEAQRVALGRALAPSPTTLCLDEPLSALDDPTRKEMYEVRKMIQSEAQVTVLHVTHNVDEARRLADCLFLLEQGVVREKPVEASDA